MSIRKPSPSMAVACIALMLGTTDTATAAKKLFTGADILNRSITRLDVAKATLTGENIKPGTFVAGQFKGGLPKGPQGVAARRGRRAGRVTARPVPASAVPEQDASARDATRDCPWTMPNQATSFAPKA